MTVGSTIPKKTYIDLLRRFPPRPISSPKELDATQAEIDNLLDQEALNHDERDYLNILGTLVHEYEEKHFPMPELRGIELLKALIAEFNLRQKDLLPIFKTESIVSAVLNGKRKLTVGHIEKLAEYFHVSPAVFF